MKLAKAEVSPLSLKLRKPIAVASGLIERREGYTIELESEEGHRGRGVAMPLESFGGESLALCGDALEHGVRELEDGPSVSLAGRIGSLRSALRDRPVALAGLELALRNLHAAAEGCSLASLLGSEIRRRPRPRVRVAALLAAQEVAECVRAAHSFSQQGIRSFKLKVGVGDPAADVRRVRAVREALGGAPRIRLRLDANRAWSYEGAVEVAKALERCELEFLEEPLAEPNEEDLVRLRAVSRVPIALDESVVRCEEALRLIAAQAADWIVLKPSVCGGLSNALAIAERASAAGLGVVVTSFLDAAPALWGALALASLVRADADAGLCGDSIFERDVGELPAVCKGQMSVDTR